MSDFRRKKLRMARRAKAPAGVAARCLAACLVLLPPPAHAGAYPGTHPPRVTGAPEVVFDWSRERCATWDIPDTPARAWLGSDGRVRLVSGSEASRASVGPALGRLARDCAVLHRGAGADDPGAYDDRVWIHATHTTDGRHVIALGHAEYHGDRRRDRCPVGGRLECWRNAVVELASEDGGRSFRRTGPVATLPYRFTGREGRRTGYFNPSNIVRRGEYLYAFVMAEAFGEQRRGPCLLRRPVDGPPGSWRAWDGAAFSRRFADPYREAVADPGRHVCAPVAGVTSTISSVVLHAPSGRFLAVTAATRPDRGGVPRSGIWWTVSDDLLGWTEPALLHEAPLLWRRDCAAPAAYAYPALLDEASRSRNFDTVGDTFWLYLVEMPLDENCRVGPERDLVRLRVSWPLP
jgi:hypothetical protein